MKHFFLPLLASLLTACGNNDDLQKPAPEGSAATAAVSVSPSRNEVLKNISALPDSLHFGMQWFEKLHYWDSADSTLSKTLRMLFLPGSEVKGDIVPLFYGACSGNRLLYLLEIWNNPKGGCAELSVVCLNENDEPTDSKMIAHYRSVSAENPNGGTSAGLETDSAAITSKCSFQVFITDQMSGVYRADFEIGGKGTFEQIYD